MTTMERILNRLFKKREIVNCDRDVYLHRWYVLRTFWITIFIHKFVRSDEDRALHDHPWNFLVIPVWRGYIEHSKKRCDCWRCNCSNPSCPSLHPWHESETRVYPIISTRYRKAEYRHRVELVQGKPSWSIFIHFRKRRDWGFWMPEGWIQWAKFWQDKCE